jgi:DNA-binding SARP family transcriptional activator
VLASQAGAVVAPDRLVDALWPEGPPRTAVDSLRTYVSRLRRVVGDGLSGHPGGYVLDVTGGVDADEFDDLVRRADTAAAHPAEAAGLWEEALARWRGPAFGDLATNPVLRPPAVRLDETRRHAQVAHARALLGAGQASQAAAAAEEIVAAEPVAEGAWVVLVDALRAADRAPEALRSYQRAVGPWRRPDWSPVTTCAGPRPRRWPAARPRWSRGGCRCPRRPSSGGGKTWPRWSGCWRRPGW